MTIRVPLGVTCGMTASTRQVRNLLPNLFGTMTFQVRVILSTISIFSELSFVSNSPQQIVSALGITDGFHHHYMEIGSGN